MTTPINRDKVSSNAPVEDTVMSCYFRHLKDILAEANIEVTPQNRKQIDQAFHKIIGVDYKECPATWKNLKQERLNDEKKRKALVKRLQNTVAQK